MLEALRIRDFRLLWGAGVISSLGSWLLVLAIPAHVYLVTRSLAATGLTVAADYLPMLLLGPVAGVLADRWDRRRLMLATDVFRAAAVALPRTWPGRGVGAISGSQPATQESNANPKDRWVMASSPDRWQRIEALFHEALELKPEARPEFLENSCHGDQELRKELETLLESAEKPIDVLRKPRARSGAAGDVAGPSRHVRSRQAPGALRDHFAAGSGRHGRSLSCRRHATPT